MVVKQKCIMLFLSTHNTIHTPALSLCKEQSFAIKINIKYGIAQSH